MKVLLGTISLDLERGGGTAQRTRLLARYLAQAGTTCRAIAMDDGDLAHQLRSEGIDVYVTGFVRPRFHFPLINPLRLRRLVRWADCLHLLGYWNLLSVTLAWLARRYGRPYFLSAAGEFAALSSHNVIKRAFHQLFGLRMITGAKALIAITELERNQIIALLKCDSKKVLVIPNGVEVLPAAAQIDPTLRNRKLILFMGRLGYVKGPDLLLEAFAAIARQFPDIHLEFCGPDGGMRDTLESRRDGLDLGDRVAFQGFVDANGRDAAYRRALILVVPSRDEAMSLVALEAGLLGVPVLLTDRCGFNSIEAVGGGRVVPATVEGLSHGLAEMLGHGDHLDKWGRRMQSYVLANYAWPLIAEQMLMHMREAASEAKDI